jgi:Uma2 family endonuclease
MATEIARHRFNLADYHAMIEHGILTERDRVELTKLPIYAKAGIAEVWIVDVVGKAVEIYAEPSDGIYAALKVVCDDGELSPRAFSDVRFIASDILDL